MIWIILIGILIVFIVVLIKQDGQQEKSTPQPAQSNSYESKYKIPRDRFLKLLGWENSARAMFVGEYKPDLPSINGYTTKPLVGIFAREDITIFDTGCFNGFAMIEPQNQYDPKAVAIWRDDEKKVGYIPKGNTELFNYIAEQGGVVHVYGMIAYNCWDDKWHGSVAVECNCNNMKYRNALIENDCIFYKPKMDLTKFLEEQQNK